MPDDTKEAPREEKVSESENSSGERGQEKLQEVRDNAQGLSSDDGRGSLEDRFQKSANSNTAESQFGDTLKKLIDREHSKVEPDGAVDRYLKAESKTDRQVIVDKLLQQSASREPDALKSLSSLSDINRFEALAKLNDSATGSDAASKRNRYDALLTLSGLETQEGKSGGPSTDILNQLQKLDSSKFPLEIDSARLAAKLEQESVQESATEILGKIMNSANSEDLGSLQAYDRAQRKQGKSDLTSLTQLAEDYKGNLDNFKPGASKLDNLSQLAESSPQVRAVMDFLAEQKLVAFDKESGKYKSLLGNDIDPKDLWQGRKPFEQRSSFSVLESQRSKDGNGRADLASESRSSLRENSKGDLVLSEEDLAHSSESLRLSEKNDASRTAEKANEPDEKFPCTKKLDNGTLYEYNSDKFVAAIHNKDGTYARFDSSGRVTEFKGKDGDVHKFTFDGDKLVAYSDKTGQWNLQTDEQGKPFFLNAENKKVFHGDIKAAAAVNSVSGEVMVTQQERYVATGTTKTTFPDGSVVQSQKNAASLRYNADGKLEQVSNGNTGETYSFKWHPPGHPNSGQIAELTVPDGTRWTPGSAANEWVSDKGQKWRGQITIDEASGNYHYKGEDGNEKHWYPDKAAQQVNARETKASTEAIYQMLNGRDGFNVDNFEKLVQGKSVLQRQAIEAQYKEMTNRSIYNDIGVRSSGSDTLRAVNAMKQSTDAHAGALAVAFTKYGESWGSGSNHLKEIRSLLSSRSAEEMEQIRKDFPESLRRAGLPVKSLDEAISSLKPEDRQACETLAKGADKLKFEDFSKLSEIALRKGDLNMFLETWKIAKPEERQAYLDSGAEKKIYAAFPGSFRDSFSKSGSYLEAGKAMDMLNLGFVGADKFVRESSGYLTGDFEEHIDSAMRNMSTRERELFVAGEKLHTDGANPDDLKGDDKVAFERYKAIHDALTVAGYPYEVHRWEEIGARGGGLLSDLSEKKGVVYDAATHDVMKTIENMSLDDFERLRREPAYRAKVEEVLKSFADGDAKNPNSEIGRCLAMIDRKCRMESDTARMTEPQQKMYERGRELFYGEQKSLSKSQIDSVGLYKKLGEAADLGSMSDAQKNAWSEGKALSADRAALDFYRQRCFDSSTNRAKRSVLESIDDNHRFYNNNTANIFEALSKMRPDEKVLCQMAQSVKDGKVDLSKLSEDEKAKYEKAIEFRTNLDQKLDAVLDRGITILSSASGIYNDFIARADRSERDVAASILDRISHGEQGKQNIIDKLNVHASHVQSDKAQIAIDIKQAFSENPELAKLGKTIAEAGRNGTLSATLAGLPENQKQLATQLMDSMRKAMGSSLYAEHGMKILDGTLSPAAQLSLRQGIAWHDKEGMLRDLNSFSPEQRKQLSAYLDPSKMSEMLKGKSASEEAEIRKDAEEFKKIFGDLAPFDQAVFKNALKNGMKPEDWLRHYCGDGFDGTNEAGVKKILGQMTDREATRRELSERPEFKGKDISDTMVTHAINQKLQGLEQGLARKYGMDLRSTLISELGGSDLNRAMQSSAKQSDNPDDIVFTAQREFFQNLGLGADFADYMRWGASTSLGMDAFDRVTASQAHDRMGLAAFDSEAARRSAMNLFEASLQMSETQTQLSDTAVDVAINVACIAATIPSGGTSLIALGANIGGKTGMMLKTAGSVLQVMDKAAKAGSVASRTEFLANWFKNASKAEQMIALGIVGGAGKVGVKSQLAGNYDLANDGARDFLSGFSDMALNVDIPLGKFARSAGGRTAAELTSVIAGAGAELGEQAAKGASRLSQDALVSNYADVLNKGLGELADTAMSTGGKVDPEAVRKLASSMVKEGSAGRDEAVKELAAKLEASLSKNVSQDMKMTAALIEAMYASRQGALAGGLGSLAYLDADAGLEQNLSTVAASAAFGGGMNFAMVLPIELAGRFARNAHLPSDAANPRLAPDAGDSSVGVKPAGDVNAKQSSTATELKVLTETDKKSHDLSERIDRLQRQRDGMSAEQIAKEENIIEEQKKQVVSELRAEAARYLSEKLGLSQAEAKSVADRLQLDLTPYDPKSGTNGIMHQDTGSIEVRLGAGFPSDRSVTQTFLHELEHLLNHTRNHMLFKENPEKAVNAIVDDCLKGLFNGGQRLEKVANASDAVDLLRPRLNGDNFSASEQAFVKQQLKDYLNSQSASAKVGEPISEADLKAWLDSRGAKFPTPENEKILLKEMVGEIEHANLVVESAKISDQAAAQPALSTLSDALSRKYGSDTKSMSHYFNGISDSMLGVGVPSIYKYASPEEIAANRAPMFRMYEQTGKQVRQDIKDISEKINKGARISESSSTVVAELKKTVDEIDSLKQNFDKQREKVHTDASGDSEKLALELKRIDADERKAVRNLEQKLFEKLGSESGLKALEELSDSGRLGANADSIIEAISGRSKAVAALKELTAQEMFARASRELAASRQGDGARSDAEKKFQSALKNLIEKTPEDKLVKTLDYVLREGLADPASLLKASSPEKLSRVVQVLRENRVPAMDILAAVPSDQVKNTALAICNAGLEKDTLYRALFDSSPDIKAGMIAALKESSGESRREVSSKIAYLMEEAESAGKLPDAVKLLSKEANLSRSDLTEYLGEKMESKVKAILDAPEPSPTPAKATARETKLSPQEIDQAAKSQEFLRNMHLLAESDFSASSMEGLALPPILDNPQLMKDFVDALGDYQKRWRGQKIELPTGDNPALFTDAQKLGLKAAEDFERTVSELLAKNGYPPIDIVIKDLPKDVNMQYIASKGRIEASAEFALKILHKGDARAFGTLVHELNHFDQDLLALRKIRDELKESGNYSAENLRKAYAEKTGVAGKVSDAMIQNLERPELSGKLSAEQSKRAEALIASLKDYKTFSDGAAMAATFERDPKIFVEFCKNPAWLNMIKNDPTVPPEIFDLTKRIHTGQVDDPAGFDRQVKDAAAVWKKAAQDARDKRYDASVHERESNEVGLKFEALFAGQEYGKVLTPKAEFAAMLADRTFGAEVAGEVSDALSKIDMSTLTSQQKAQAFTDATLAAVASQYKLKTGRDLPPELKQLTVEISEPKHQAFTNSFGASNGKDVNSGRRRGSADSIDSVLHIKDGAFDLPADTNKLLAAIYSEIYGLSRFVLMPGKNAGDQIFQIGGRRSLEELGFIFKPLLDARARE